MFACPHCNKMVKDLNSHIARIHPEKVEQRETPAASPAAPAEDENENLEIEGETEAHGDSAYHCVDCGAAIEKGQQQCPNCGTELDWSGIQ